MSNQRDANVQDYLISLSRLANKIQRVFRNEHLIDLKYFESKIALLQS